MKRTHYLVAAAASLATVLALQASGVAAEIPPALQDVKRWRLTFNYEETAAEKLDDHDWELNITASGSAVLERTDDPFGEWIGTPSVTVSYSYTGYRGEPMCYTDEQVMGTGGPIDPENSASLRFFQDGYQLEPSAHNVPITLHQINACPESHEENFPGQRYYYQHGIISDSVPYPTDTLELSGTLRDDTHEPNSEQTVGNVMARTRATLSYQLTPELDPLVLEIVDSGDYLDWRPSVGDVRGNPGEQLTLRAELKTESGEEPKVKIEKITWALTGTSREPGFSMNYPIDAGDSEPDLQLEAAAALGVDVRDEGQVLEHLLLAPSTSDEVLITPYDWGGWSTLRVTAVLEDGRTLVGKARSSKEEELRLPKRAPDSYIADAWKKKTRASGSDHADVDAKPEGDGTQGDGLSLYEEYRGFYEKGEHVEGDPTTKDLFVLAAQPTRTGVALFKRLTQLAVHMYLRGSELPPSRVINANRSGGPNVTDQHALRVVVSPHFGEAAGTDHGNPAASGHSNLLGGAIGGPGTPKDVSEVRLMRGWPALPLGKRNHVVAHELLHAVNVYHHGEIDDQLVAWGLDEEGALAEVSDGGKQAQYITVFREVRHDITRDYEELLSRPALNGNPILGWLGKEEGQHSGNDACVMRYFAADAYVGNPDVTQRYVTREVAGTNLCKDPAGSGVNDPGREPQSRFGAAAENRGDCMHQILVNDAVDRPRR